MNRALFLDRDGVLDELVFYPGSGEWESPRHVRDLKLLPGVTEALRKAGAAGWLLFILTNQPSFAKGKCPLQDLQDVQDQVLAELRRDGVNLTRDYVCFHHPQSILEGFGPCRCRKPSPLRIEEASAAWNLDLSRCWMVGDQDIDVVTGINAGCRTALLNYVHSANKRGMTRPDLICADLAELVRKLD